MYCNSSEHTCYACPLHCHADQGENCVGTKWQSNSCTGKTRNYFCGVKDLDKSQATNNACCQL